MKQCNNRKSWQGFTLLELVIVMAVIGILASLGVVSFVKYSNSQALSAAASDLANTLNVAKARSLSQVKPSACNSIDGYEVRICGLLGSTCISPSVSFELDVKCGGSVVAPSITTKKLPTDINFDVTTTSKSFFFPVLTGGVIGSGTVVLSGYGRTKNVTVSLSGDIQ